MSTVEKYHEYCILSIMGDTQYCGGYHEYCVGVQYRGGIQSLLFEYPHSTEQLPVLTISPIRIMISPNGTHITKDDILHGTEYQLRYS